MSICSKNKMIELLVKISILMLSLINSCQPLCRPLVLPSNGIFSAPCKRIQTPGAICTIKCQAGYAHWGPSFRICQRNGYWSGTATKCVKNVETSCPAIRELQNGLVNNSCATKYIVGCGLTFKCSDGYKLNGIQTIICLRPGQWSSAKPECSAMPTKCPTLTSTMGGVWINRANSYECTGYPGETCSLGCRQRFRLVGPTFAYCDLKTHEWSKPIPECVRY